MRAASIAILALLAVSVISTDNFGHLFAMTEEDPCASAEANATNHDGILCSKLEAEKIQGYNPFPDANFTGSTTLAEAVQGVLTYLTSQNKSTSITDAQITEFSPKIKFTETPAPQIKYLTGKKEGADVLVRQALNLTNGTSSFTNSTINYLTESVKNCTKGAVFRVFKMTGADKDTNASIHQTLHIFGSACTDAEKTEVAYSTSHLKAAWNTGVNATENQAAVNDFCQKWLGFQFFNHFVCTATQ